jgi:hypothetical protein
VTGRGNGHGAVDPEDPVGRSDRRGWLIATAIEVVLILGAGVFLVSRAAHDPGMPGMDMGSESLEGGEKTLSAIPARADGAELADDDGAWPEEGRR